MQVLIWIIPILCFLAIVMIALLIRKSNKKLQRIIDSEFGSIPEHEDFDIDLVNGYHYYSLKENKSAEYIDKVTWNDLDMDDVYKRIDNCQTSIGQEYLYHKLHEVCFDEEKRADYNNLVSLFGNEKRRKDVQLYLAKLGKSNYSISSLAFEPKQYKLKMPSLVYTFLAILAVLLIITTIVCISLSLKVASLFLILSFINIVSNIVLYYITKLRLENQLNMLSFFSGALWTCRKMQ